MKTIKLLAITVIALAACGDNKTAPDARVRDSGGPDSEIVPAAPMIGMQVDRMGRAAVNTALNHGFDSTTAAQPAKVAYNEQTMKTDWLAAAQVGEFMRNLAMVDTLDTGICGNGICEVGETGTTCPAPMGDCMAGQTGMATTGCGNQVLHNGMATGGGTPGPTSYATLASILADDELYLDTSKTSCTFYLGVEFGVVTGGGNSTCGGRTPTYDVIDFSFSMLVMGLRGFDTSFAPQVKDNAGPHADVSVTDFPFLGAPH